jgi:hypothetical protein
MISVLQQLAEHNRPSSPGHRVPWRESGCGGDGRGDAEFEQVTTVGAASVFRWSGAPDLTSPEALAFRFVVAGLLC